MSGTEQRPGSSRSGITPDHARVPTVVPDSTIVPPKIRVTATRTSTFADDATVDTGAMMNDVEAIVWEASWPSWRYTFVNRHAEQVLGFSRERWLSEHHFWMNHLHPDDRAAAIAHSLGNIEHGQNHQHEFRMLSADGSPVWLREAVHLVHDDNGVCRKLRGTMVDITEAKNHEEALRLSEHRFRSFYDEEPMIVLGISRDGLIKSVNGYGAGKLGYQVHELTGVRLIDLHPAEQAAAVQSQLNNYRRSTPGEVNRWESSLICKDGAIIVARVVARTVSDGEQDNSILLMLCEDVTEERRRSDKLAHQATHDPLTSLINRSQFEKSIQRLLYGAYENRTRHVLCLLDLDQFKVINYRLGHAAGDEFLRELAEILPDCLRPTDVVARVGGDEFGVLLENCSMQRAKGLASELLTAIAAHDFDWAGSAVRLSASIGLVSVDAHSDSVAELMSTADTARRAASEKGRGRIHVYDADDSAITAHQNEMEWAARVEAALQEGNFRLFFQQISPVRENNNQSRYYELLLRMQGPDGEMITPGQFLPAAERYQLATQVDRWVVGRAVDWLVGRPIAQVSREVCCINLSGHSLADPAFLTFALEKLSRQPRAARSICFEITETALIEDLQRAIHCIQTLRRSGCRFALDDFGSGVSSFAYLKQLPVDYLKIDGIFVREIARADEDLKFLSLINKIGHATGKKTIAEFVESKEVLDRLSEIGVDFAQGHHIAEPRPIEHYRYHSQPSNETGRVAILRIGN